jgi:hypothetical protein
VYRTLIRPVVANPFTRPVAPVAALDSTRTREVPAIRPRSRVRIHVHGSIVPPGEVHRRLRLWGRDGAEAGDGERRIVGGTLALEAHIVVLQFI